MSIHRQRVKNPLGRHSELLRIEKYSQEGQPIEQLLFSHAYLSGGLAPIHLIPGKIIHTRGVSPTKAALPTLVPEGCGYLGVGNLYAECVGDRHKNDEGEFTIWYHLFLAFSAGLTVRSDHEADLVALICFSFF